MKRLAGCLALLLMGCGDLGPNNIEVYNALACYGKLVKMDSAVTVLKAASICWENGKSPL